MAIKCSKCPYIPKGHIVHQPFPFQGPPKFSQNLDFWFENGNPGQKTFCKKNCASLAAKTAFKLFQTFENFCT
jgi:hypothetical protein